MAMERVRIDYYLSYIVYLRFSPVERDARSFFSIGWYTVVSYTGNNHICYFTMTVVTAACLQMD